MDRVFTGAFDATIDSMGTRRDWEEGAKNRLNRLGLRSATLENAVTGKKVPSTAIGLPHMLYNKDRAIGGKSTLEARSGRGQCKGNRSSRIIKCFIKCIEHTGTTFQTIPVEQDTGKVKIKKSFLLQRKEKKN